MSNDQNQVNINLDSCQQRLLLFDQSGLELKKALKFYRRRNKFLLVLGIELLPELGFDEADEITHGSTSWVHTTSIYLSIALLGSIIYLATIDHQFRLHLKKALAAYNAQIMGGSGGSE